MRTISLFPALLALLLLLLLPSACGGGGSGGGTSPPAPTLISVTPSTGWGPTATLVTLRGSGFDAGLTSITVGGLAATEVTAVDASTSSCRVPPTVTPGPVPVTVSTSNGDATLAGGFTFYRIPPNFVAPDVRVDSDVPGADSSGNSHLCCNGPNVHVVWQDYRNGRPDIYYRGSADAGATWHAAERRLNTDVAGSAYASSPKLCCDGSTVYAVWGDDRNVGFDIFFQRSEDGGRTWLAEDVRLDTDAPGSSHSAQPQICCDGQAVCVIWVDQRSGREDLYANRSLDGGTTWLADDVRIDTDTPGSAESTYPALCREGSNVCIVWRDLRSVAPGIYFSRSTDGGGTWLGTDLRLGGTGDLGVPSVCCEGSRVYAAWADARNGSMDVFIRRSLDGGGTWQAEARLDTDDPGDAHSSGANVGCAGTDVYVVWSDQRGTWEDIYLNRSTDGGVTWMPSDHRLDTDPVGSGRSFVPEIACDGSNVYVVWHDERDGFRDVYLNLTIDGGLSWLANDLRLDTDAAGAASSSYPKIACDGARVYVVWSDTRDGNQSDIYLGASRP